MIAGGFAMFNGTLRNRIVRLNSDGSLDNTFNLGDGPDNDVLAAVLLDSGQVVIGGNFSVISGKSKGSVARLNVDGSVDPNYNAGAGVDASVQSLAAQFDGAVLVGGFFAAVDGVSRNGIARLLGDSAPAGLHLANPRWANGLFSTQLATFSGESYTLDHSDSLASDAWVSGRRRSWGRHGADA